MGAILLRDVKPEFWFMEPVDMIRRLMLTCMPVAFINSGYAVVLVVSLGVALLALVIQNEFQPYKMPAMNTVKVMEAWQNLLIVIVLLIQDADTFKRKAMYNLAGAGVVTIDVMMLAVMAWAAWRRGACGARNFVMLEGEVEAEAGADSTALEEESSGGASSNDCQPLAAAAEVAAPTTERERALIAENQKLKAALRRCGGGEDER